MNKHPEYAKITAYLDTTTPIPETVDLIFVPGTRMPTPAMIAADLFKQDIALYIVLTGGENCHTRKNEAEAHKAILLREGVPLECLIVENRSTNTLENVQFAMPLIEQRVAWDDLTSILIIAKWMHSRRVMMTLKRQLPVAVRFYATTYAPDNITQRNWPAHPERVLKNWQNIPEYMRSGHIAEVTRVGDHYV